jgi:hypothetical protein
MKSSMTPLVRDELRGLRMVRLVRRPFYLGVFWNRALPTGRRG